MFRGLRVLLKRRKSTNSRSSEQIEDTSMESPNATNNMENVQAADMAAAIDTTNKVDTKSIECQTILTSMVFDNNPTVSTYDNGMFMALEANFSRNPLYKTFDDNAKAVGENSSNNDMEIAQSGNSEILYKHPLQRVWTLWYFVNDRFKTWAEMQNEIISFDTVEDFWEVTQCIVPPSELKMFCQFSIFKQNIRPMWEDAANRNGGRWVLSVHKALTEDMDNMWLDVILCLIGEVFVNMDEVCGAVVNRSYRSNKISIWTSNGCNEQAILEIGYKMREVLRLTPRQVLHYQLHLDSIVVQGKHIKATYTI